MTNEDKKLVAGYMGWRTRTHAAHVLNMHEDFVFTTCDNGLRNIYFDLNDVGACVKEMQKRGDWRNFLIISRNLHRLEFDSQVIEWLFNADNFFEAMAKWLKEEKK